ncbi:MAG: amidohydrolase [Clostridiales bacterium]|jgi:imidazolonepropionase-like amidohydrolase|nr:amidohydrolase [Clostridiales bacterium]
MLLINAKIYSMDIDPIDNGYLWIDGEKIGELGEMSRLSRTDDDTVDLQGKRIYPGFIDAHTHLGMFEDGLTFEGDDGNEETDPITPQLRAVDAVNPMDRCFSEALDAGVTTVVTGPGSANAIAGQMLAMKTSGRRIDDMILREPAAIKFALGENPKSVYHGKNQMPSTRMATAAVIREQLTKARRYQQEKRNALENSEEFDCPEYDAKCEALLPLLEKKISAHFHAHRADDIFTAIRIAKEFDIDYVIVHGTEGHLIPLELKEEHASVLAGPILCDRSKPELKQLTPKNPGILADAGIETAIITDHPVIPIQYLPICAALAVREGMTEQQALRAITTIPARICGLGRRVGALKPGMDADFSVFEQNPLQLTAKPIMVYCNGKRVR